jgi:hypothetical protein
MAFSFQAKKFITSLAHKTWNHEEICLSFGQEWFMLLTPQFKFLALSEAKVKEGAFDVPQIPKLMKYAAFTNTKNDVERQAWNAFIEIIKKFLGKVKNLSYKEIIENMLETLRVLG